MGKKESLGVIMKDKGYVQVYTGNGKGKTTSSMGLMFRALGAGYSVFVGQFIKGMKYHEVQMAERVQTSLLKDQKLNWQQYGRGCFIWDDPTQEDIDIAIAGFFECKNILTSNEYDVVILDEIHIALYYKLITEEMVLDLIDSKPENVELILTGRYCPQSIIDRADLVTEMKEIKHYYEKGVEARDGIER